MKAQSSSLDQWQRDRFGMFIHWGLYALPGLGEWVMFQHGIRIRDYEQLGNAFRARQYRPLDWARLARAAGMRYMVFTAKHHDGFCLFNTRFTRFNSMCTAAGRDLLAEYVEACRAEGLKVGVYYSITDWHHPAFPMASDCPLARLEPRARRPDPAKYMAFMENQIRELLTNYGKVDILWFDQPYQGFDGRPLAQLIRRLQPHVLINDRLCSADADFFTPEQRLPAEPFRHNGKSVAWEACYTMTGQAWGYHRYDKDWRAPEDVLRMLVHCASLGGNFLLNVGPDPEGVIPSGMAKRLRMVGSWLRRWGNGVYDTAAGPVSRMPGVWFTSSGRCLYLHIFNWPRDGWLELPTIAATLTQAQILGGSVLQVSNGKLILPARALDTIGTVVKLTYATPPRWSVVKKKRLTRRKHLPVDYTIVEGRPIVVDGYIDEQAWQGARVVAVSRATHHDHAPERYPGCSRYAACAYRWRAMHAGGLLYVAVEVESPTRQGRPPIPAWRADEVRLLFAANPQLAKKDNSPEAFEIDIDAGGALWMPHEQYYPGCVVRHAVRPTDKGYNVVVAIPLAMMMRDRTRPATALRLGDCFRFDVYVVQPAPPYRVGKTTGRKWWERLTPHRQGLASMLFWHGNGDVANINTWGLCRIAGR